jgi:hypothetical protein
MIECAALAALWDNGTSRFQRYGSRAARRMRYAGGDRNFCDAMSMNP